MEGACGRGGAATVRHLLLRRAVTPLMRRVPINTVKSGINVFLVFQRVSEGDLVCAHKNV